jgi:hypothetical protein
MRILLVGLMLSATLPSIGFADPLDPPAGTGVVFAETVQASARLEPAAQVRTIRTIDRVARALDSQTAPRGTAGLGELAFDVQVFGVTPRVDVLEAFDIGPLAPAAFGPPTHLEWLTQVTPAALRATAPSWPLRPRLGW